LRDSRAAEWGSLSMILVAIGANLPGPHGEPPLLACQAAAAALGRLPGLRLEAVSRWYATSPEPPSGQPDYVNGVARLSGEADPAWLLARLLAIEAGAGRRRSVPNAARTLDLDLIAMGDLLRERPDPVLPHPRAHLRGFVLLPLADVAPAWRHPLLCRSVAELIAALPPRRIALL
jgi:2-amino-4-hydroxy-6-hydroxymethyldihydropteridine diphosphokinase